VQLVLRTREDGALSVENVGRCPMSCEGREQSQARLAPGDLIRLGTQLVFVCVRRPPWLSGDGGYAADVPFGEADPHGIVGESPAIWELRQRVLFVAGAQKHVLVLGASGTGKELVARAIHALSQRAKGPFVARSAATLPEALIEAELFGNAKNYPNPGMQDRPGLIGEAHTGSLFLDEFGELSTGSQGRLLRVLDEGEYQRLGEAATRRSDVRLIAATNRDVSALKEDLVARFPLRVHVPDLNARREDIPFLVRHLLRLAAKASPKVASRMHQIESGAWGVGITSTEALVRRRYTTHVRELEALLWASLSQGEGELSFRNFDEEGAWDRGQDDEAGEPGASGLPTIAQIRACLDRHNGVVERAWRELGLKNRHVLSRLIVRHGIEIRQRPVPGRRRSRDA
jgi:DNA-binding NtrC family response regulator